MNSAFVSKRSVATAKIDQPKFANVLQMNERVPPRHFRRLHDNRISTGPSERTTALDWMTSTIGCFQPGTFLWGHAHAEGCYQRPTIHAKRLPQTQGSSEHANPGGVAEPSMTNNGDTKVNRSRSIF